LRRQLGKLRLRLLLLGHGIEELAREAEPPEPLTVGDGSARAVACVDLGECGGPLSLAALVIVDAHGEALLRVGELGAQIALAVYGVLQAEQDDEFAADPRRAEPRLELHQRRVGVAVAAAGDVGKAAAGAAVKLLDKRGRADLSLAAKAVPHGS